MAAICIIQDFLGGGWNDNGDYSVNQLIPKISRLKNLMSGHPSVFKANTGFRSSEFEDMAGIVFPVISRHAHHACCEWLSDASRIIVRMTS